MSAGPLFARFALTIALCAPPAVILAASGPPNHESWWYPNPERWDYPIKLRLYAVLDTNLGPENQPVQKWFAKTVAAIIVVMICAAVWSNIL